jgi:prolyl oligopeptidase
VLIMAARSANYAVTNRKAGKHMRLRNWAAAAAMTIGFLSNTGFAADAPADPYLWLEDIKGEKPLDWVKEQNAAAFAKLKTDPGYAGDYAAILAILDATDRIPTGDLQGNFVFNFWQDENHVRGIWRRTTVASYATPNPQWETLLDVDKLAADEGKNWFFHSAECPPDLSRCLIALSPGGGDTVVLREFDMASKSFPANGFNLGEAKAEAAYIDADTILFSTDFGKGTLTDSGYPRIVKLWRRGQPLAGAKVVFEGMMSDVVASPGVFQGSAGPVAMASRAISYFETEYHVLAADGSAVELPLPLSADAKALLGGDLIVSLRKDWTPDGGVTIKQGSLVAFPVKEFLATRKMPHVSVLYTPGPRASVGEVEATRDAVYASIFENVTGSIHIFRPNAGVWRDQRLDLPAGGTTGIASTNAFGPEALFSYMGFLTPTTLFASKGEPKPATIKALPARFDASPYAQVQYEAVSADGTKIPYFVVRPKDARGGTPMVLYGYGGFEISSPPFYWSSAGKVWLSKGGAYAVANIRGGGEFGPAWHEAAVKTNRQKGFDDFIAVAEDMIKRGLTTPRQLGIMGGSNGGLLVGTVAVQRPDLFGAVVCEVPLLDMIRYTKLGAGASWIGEYGDPDVPVERAAILRYSPYQNVKEGVVYPPIFFITATSDDRVTPVHARKMAAKMEAQGHDVLFYENTDGGHAAAANHAQQAEMNALAFTYLVQKLGLGK